MNSLKDFKWVIINFTIERDRNVFRAPNDNQVNGLIRTIIRSSRDNGLNLPEPSDTRSEKFGFRNDVKDLIKGLKEDIPSLKFILFLIPKNRDELYNQIKYQSEVVFDLATQCVSHDKTRNFEDLSYVSNLMLKINAKLGGTNVRISRQGRLAYMKNKVYRNLKIVNFFLTNLNFYFIRQ